MRALLAFLAAATVLVANAQGVPAAEPLRLQGKTVDGRPFALSSLKGKVVLVMFWSTACAVCRDKMPELRQNYEGWHGKPFELVLVSTDGRLQDLNDYEKIIASVVPSQQRFPALWSGDSSYQDNFGKPVQLPLSFLLDKSGNLVERYQGRIPPQAWDRIAEML